MNHKPISQALRAAQIIVLCLIGLGLALLIISCDNDPKPPEPPIVENANPVAYTPLIVSSSFTTRSHILADVRYRKQGCDASGHPTSVTGAYDPDGDSLEYRFACPWSVFKLGTNEKINDQWVTFPIVVNPSSVIEQDAQVEFWIEWTNDYPLMPTAPQCEPNPYIEPTVFTYEARDEHGAISAHSVTLGR